MQKTTDRDGADSVFAVETAPQENPIRKLMLGFLHPSEMTPEERMEELASILADGYLRLKIGVGPSSDEAPCLKRRNQR